MGVSVMGVGMTGAVPTSDGLSYRELIADAARMAYLDAGVEPEQLDGVVSVEEDMVSGYSMADAERFPATGIPLQCLSGSLYLPQIKSTRFRGPRFSVSQ